jgi:quercetin dioxygenase-like cupin family protein
MKLILTTFVCMYCMNAQDVGHVRKLSENKFAPLPMLPACNTMAVESGDPTKGPSVLAIKSTTGCAIPWHWHTPNEHVMLVSGAAKMEMKGAATATFGPGGYAMMPSKHVHQFTCTAACTGFVYSDAAFDIHYVDASGKEIPIETVVGKKK